MAPEIETMPIWVDFAGGLQTLFSNKPNHMISLPIFNPSDFSPANVGFLISHLVKNHLKHPQTEFFVQEDGHLTPGILVLINDVDWELEGEEEYELKPGDNVIFVSTMHGG
ncbi:ubiquitin-related modifier 1 [Apiosordaria backusii]|uniref:Ubiquitin-related modifier 1 n=1 Tax=Apiosordaria backusii TaxID=314023 RepID=A0AA40BSX4_9PEZI|nr:ubiquitin-related modifier 1 [Apiosordaria backusii]